MILSGLRIKEEVQKKNITIDPFNEADINPNSYNCTLGDYILVYENEQLDAKVPQTTKRIEIPKEGLVIESNKVYLGYTKEKFGSNIFVPTITGRSSTGRLGLFVQITADLVDLGFIGNLTFQLHATMPVKIYKDMKLGQIMFWNVLGDIDLYKGKYQDASSPRASESWREFIEEKK